MGLASINIRFRVDLQEFSSEMQNALRSVERFGQRMQEVGSKMSTFISLPIAAAGAASIKLASDFEESTNKVDVAFGNSSQSVKDFSKTTLESFGIAAGSALEMASLFGDMGTSMGLPRAEAAKMSTSLVGLAGDLASFKNIKIEVAQTALAGIFTGETESLKKLGIVMTEAALQEYAYAQGIRTKVADMGQAEKVQLRYNYVIAKTTNAQGDFERTGGGAANQMRIFQETLKEVGTSLGQVILPVFTKIITKVNEWLKAFNNLSEGSKTTIVVVAGIAAALGPLLLVIGAVASAIPAITAGFAAMGVTSLATLGPVLAIVAGVAAIAYVIVNNWGPIKQTLVEVANYFIDLYNNSMLFRAAVEVISAAFKNTWVVVKVVFSNILETIKFVGKNIFEVFKTLGGLLKSVLTFDLNGLKTALATGFSTISANATTFFKKLAKSGLDTSDELKKNLNEALKNTLNLKVIEKLKIPKEIIDATAVTEAVAEAVQKGVGGKKDATSKVSSVGGGLQSAGLFDINTESLIKSTETTEQMMLRLSAAVAGAKTSLQSDMIEISSILNDQLNQLANNAAVGFGEMLGSVISGTASLGDLFKGMLGIVGNFLSSLGKSLIQVGIASAAFKKAFANPFVAIAAGIALVALGAIVQSTLSKGPGGGAQAFANGGIVGGTSFYGDKILARVNSGEMIANDAQQKAIYGAMNSASNVNVTLGGGFEIDGNKLRLVLGRTDNRNSRLG